MGFLGVFGNVSSEVIELLNGTNKMIESILLPEVPSTAQGLVYFRCGKMLPRFALLEHTLHGRKRRQQMDVIGHDYEIAQFTAIMIKMVQAVRDDF